MPKKERIPKGKVQLVVLIPEELNEKLRKLIMKKYKRFARGLLSYEVSLAIESHIAAHTKNTQTQIREPNPFPKSRIVFEDVKKYLKKQFGYISTIEVLRPHLIAAIKAVRGSDPRTVRKWLREFEESGLIKWIAYNRVELL